MSALGSLALEVLRRVGLEVGAAFIKRWRWRRAHPCEVAVFHATMLALGTTWPRWHRWAYRRARARCVAFGDDGRCAELTESATRLARAMVAEADRQVARLGSRRPTPTDEGEDA